MIGRMDALDHKRATGHHLRLLRLALGRSVGEMALMLGVSSSRLANWESGHHYPDPYVMYVACLETGVTMDWIYRGVRAGVSSSLAAGLRAAEGAEQAGRRG